MQELDSKIERVVLSAILFSPDKFDEICDSLVAQDFSLPLHVEMFKACENLHRNETPITPEFLCIEMQKSMKVSLDDIALIAAESPIADIDTYVKMIKNSSIKRNLFSPASFMRDESMKPDSIAQNILADIEQKVYALSIQDTNNAFKNAYEVVESTMRLIKENQAKHGALKGINTGFSELNNATTGFNAGELIVIGARPAMGKTALILSMTLKILSSQKGVAIFSLEMPAEQLMTRMLSAKSMVPLQNVRSGSMDDNEFTKLSKSAQELCETHIYIDDNPHLSLAGLRTKLRKLKIKDPSVSIVMIDYLQLMSGMSNANAAARHEIIAEISRGLKNLARELKIPIVALSQLNRALELRDDKRPIMSDLRESGSIEQDADVILFLYRDEVYKERESRNRIAKQKKSKSEDSSVEIEEQYKAPEVHEAELILAKNRNGETRTIKIEYNSKYTLFVDRNEEREIKMAAQSNTALIGDVQTINLNDGVLPKF